MGIAYDQIKDKYPGLIFSQILGYGEKGPLKDKPGFDYTAYSQEEELANLLWKKEHLQQIQQQDLVTTMQV